MSIEITSLTKLYGQQKAVDNISFSVAKGEILGFLGPNGAGKSTTMKIATCFIPPSEGQVRICGHDVVTESMAVRKKIGYLPEHNSLYLDMYVREYLAFTGSLFGLKGDLLHSRIREMIEVTGLVPEKSKKLGQLSKGYRQRVGLAAAMIHHPEVLILDEPTTGLDPNQIVEIRNLIKTVGKEKTVIFSTHIMQEVEILCDRVVIINGGKIVADNAVNKLASAAAQQSTFKILIEFESEINQDELKSISQVSDIKTLGPCHFEIYASADIRPILFKKAGELGWVMIEMKLEEMSLEKVFHSLTSR